MDFAERGRKVAEQLGAEVGMDPAEQSPHSSWADYEVPATLQEHAIAKYTGDPADAIIFECVGKKGVLQQVINDAPPASPFIVGGVCTETAPPEPVVAAAKEGGVGFVTAHGRDEGPHSPDRVAGGRNDADAPSRNSSGRR